ncbi:Aste57867_19796 [Aphanomyces stellatus]|uniref:Aste57867_19796 protein n=1 Tax=Aphanomyces stellatus TaxID=120398 RepID=A0A485LDA3_9STRA|nr:hypothetical protein As57867_019731 [Aphanomyces stellatus]VFT96494.1 Aste57867_19796 [Aphanomyces stellatus]
MTVDVDCVKRLARRLEQTLYTNATSTDAYSDVSTLKDRAQSALATLVAQKQELHRQQLTATPQTTTMTAAEDTANLQTWQAFLDDLVQVSRVCTPMLELLVGDLPPANTPLVMPLDDNDSKDKQPTRAAPSTDAQACLAFDPFDEEDAVKELQA